VDGAYGALAAALPDASADLKGLALADSVAVDPHKWLYAPLEAGCALVRDRQALVDAFSYHPAYYTFDPEATNFYELGPQNSRGFRALKVWLALRQAGRNGYVRMISDDIGLARELHRAVTAHPELEAVTQGLSITTFRFVPEDLATGTEKAEEMLNELNGKLLERLQASGEAYLSNAVVDGKFLLRACVVNFRTTLADIEAIPGIVARIGREVYAGMRR
jgi:glutamate/tyrosine decarboxylase-like PLP-dependent enzyme